MAKNRLDICKQAWADKSKARTAAAERCAADPSMREWDVKVKRRHADDYREAAESLAAHYREHLPPTIRTGCCAMPNPSGNERLKQAP